MSTNTKKNEHDLRYKGQKGHPKLGSHTEIRHCSLTCLTETTVAPLICMLQIWFIFQKIAKDSGNLLRFKPGP